MRVCQVAGLRPDCSFTSAGQVARLLAVLLISVVTVWGQGGVISGNVTDPSGAAVAGAQVVVTDMGTNFNRQTATSSIGAFTVTSLAPSSYRVVIEANGFRKYSDSNIQLRVDERLRVDAVLSVGALSDAIEVTAQASPVNTQDGVLRNVVEGRQMTDIPLNGRNPLQLVAMTPGVVPNVNSTSSWSTSANQVSVSISGSSYAGVNYKLDGAENMEVYTMQSNALPNPDLLSEFSVQTNAYSAEHGGRAGGVVDAVTKAGTNVYHGSAYEYIRNFALNGRNFFALGNDGLKRHQYGFSGGGPLSIPGLYNGKNRTFFYGGMQWTSLRSTPTTSTTTTWTAAQRGGDFSKYIDGVGRTVSIKDPSNQTPYPGNVIPASQLSPITQKFLEYVPTATDPTGLLRYRVQNVVDNVQGSIRVDHAFSSQNRLNVRYLKENNDTPSVVMQATSSPIPTPIWCVQPMPASVLRASSVPRCWAILSSH